MQISQKALDEKNRVCTALPDMKLHLLVLGHFLLSERKFRPPVCCYEMLLFFRLNFICKVGVVLTGIGVALIEVGVARAAPKVYKPPPLLVIQC